MCFLNRGRINQVMISCEVFCVCCLLTRGSPIERTTHSIPCPACKSVQESCRLACSTLFKSLNLNVPEPKYFANARWTSHGCRRSDRLSVLDVKSSAWALVLLCLSMLNLFELFATCLSRAFLAILSMTAFGARARLNTVDHMTVVNGSSAISGALYPEETRMIFSRMEG